MKEETKNKTAIIGGGCFWCTEAIFKNLAGVDSVTSGYSGGEKENPSYEDICTGLTGHAEVVKIEYDSTKISFEELLLVFFKTHNPTTLNRQGVDKGTQYRSVIFYLNNSQKEIAEKMIKDLTTANVWKENIVTEVTPFTIFYEAESYHHDYYENNKFQGYCQVIINPKIEQFKKEFKQKLKK